MNSQTPQTPGLEREAQAGFSLIEVLIAIVVLVFGIISVANLMVVAAANNMSANQNSAAVSAAVQEMELLKTMPFNTLPLGITVQEVGVDPAPGRDERAVARIHVIRKVDVVPPPAAPGTVFITVTATPITALNSRVNINPANPPVTRSQAIFTSFRTREGQ